MSRVSLNVDDRFLEKLGFAATCVDRMAMIEPDILNGLSDKHEVFMILADCAVYVQQTGYSRDELQQCGREYFSELLSVVEFNPQRVERLNDIKRHGVAPSGCAAPVSDMHAAVGDCL